jgi:hypothetical protein
VKEGILKEILSCLPQKHDKNVNVEITTKILKRFALLSLNLFYSNTTKDQHLECESKLLEIDGYEFLFHCFNTYPEIINKQYIAAILCRFHSWINFPPKYLIILIMLKEIIRNLLKGKNSECDLSLNDFLGCLVSMSHGKEYFFNLKIIPIIINLVETNKEWERANGMIILNNIRLVPSEELQKEFADLCIPLLLQTLSTLYSSSFKNISPADDELY